MKLETAIQRAEQADAEAIAAANAKPFDIESVERARNVAAIAWENVKTISRK